MSIDPMKVLSVLDTLYDKALAGVPMVSRSVEEMADGYLIRSYAPADAAKMLMNNQILKCTTSGFVTGLGGLFTLPVTLPANISSVLYIQLRMAAAIAYIGGFHIRSGQVQTLVYACMTGTAAAEVLKETGITAGGKIVGSALDKIPDRVLLSINEEIAGRLLIKMGLDGAEQLTKIIPVVGGIVGGVTDLGTTKIIAQNAYDIFIRKRMPQSGYLAEKYRRLTSGKKQQ